MTQLNVDQITLTRFNALGGYARSPLTWLVFEELAYFEVEGGNVIGIATRDIVDSDFGGVVLAKDQKLRFRSVNTTGFFPSAKLAEQALLSAMQETASANIEDHHQGDEKGNPVDFFAHLHDETRLHPSFVQLTTSEGYSPAREIIEPMMRWYEDADGNFVEQFQTFGFDQRIWELYLFATLIEAGYTLNRDHSAPDFSCDGSHGRLSVEAVTVGPTFVKGKLVPPPSTKTPEELDIFLKEYMTIKFGSPLILKIKEKVLGKGSCQGWAICSCYSRLFRADVDGAFKIGA